MQREKKQWVKSINRANFIPSSTAVVCIQHFSSQFIIKEDRIVRDDGSELVVPRKIWKLTNDAYPSIFPNQPSYLSHEPCTSKKSPSERITALKLRDEQNFAEWCTNDTVNSFEIFQETYAKKLGDGWLNIRTDNFVLCYRLDINQCPSIVVSMKIYKDLTVEIWHDSVLLKTKSYHFILGEHNKCDQWTKFDSLLSWLAAFKPNDVKPNEKIENAIHLIKDAYSQQDDSDKTLFFSVIIEQLKLTLSSKHIYSTEFLLLAAKFYFCYPAAYSFIRSSKILILPHPVYIKKLSNALKGPKEIYVNPGLNYKGGKLLGKAENANQQANTIQAFTITSLFSKYKEIVALVPMKNQTADDLYCQTLKVLQMLNDCKYNVLCLISDNNRINRNMFTQMCQGNLVNCISNPVQPENKLFFLFDTVHLIKSVRNNWFNEKTLGQVLCFPSPDNSSKISLAKLQDLKDIYETEKSNLIKNAPKLSQKVLYPTSFEKQNVLLALNKFHESNSAAFTHEAGEKGKDTMGTKEFIDQFLKWWNIVNVKNSEKGKRLKNPFCNPIRSKDQMSMVFLNKFYDWLVSWNNKSALPLEKRKKLGLPGKGGKLTKETQFALQFTTKSLIDIVNHIFKEHTPEYILLEKKGEFHIKSLEIFEATSETSVEFEVDEELYEVFDTTTDVEISPEEMPAFIYISGYVAKKVSQKLNCDLCTSKFITTKGLEYEIDTACKYVSLLDRGGLKWPTKYTLEILVESYQIFNKLIRKEFEEKFLKANNHKQLLEHLIFEKMELLNSVPEVSCECKNNFVLIVKQCISISANIFLNNYTKIKNDQLRAKNLKRKLSTLGY
ncbi:hypothetical protein AVEN_206343-1 [Araneus ventricosus]|uniref:Uncharacterized protein n=1 Tax=Araneus ventricosus TaxID=182803 RepID=A0A4Y2JD54_ARAVE|nr:hypothetical protein AVEN_206343-1 [Araneus ventricosus]